MHKAVKQNRIDAFLRKLFRIKSPSDNVRKLERIMEEYNKEHSALYENRNTVKGLERLSKALKETQVLQGRKGGLIK